MAFLLTDPETECYNIYNDKSEFGGDIMRVAILGLGVIGTTYAYAFQKAGHETFHIIRDGKKTFILKYQFDY